MRKACAIQAKIREGELAIAKAQAEGREVSEWGNYVVKLEEHLLTLLDQIPELKLSEFEKGDYSIEVYSTILKRPVWFCPDQEAVDGITRENPEAVCYTSAELRHLISLNPRPESLKSIHEGKAVLNGSIIDQRRNHE